MYWPLEKMLVLKHGVFVEMNSRQNFGLETMSLPSYLIIFNTHIDVPIIALIVMVMAEIFTVIGVGIG